MDLKTNHRSVSFVPGLKWVITALSFHLQVTKTNAFVLSKEERAKGTTNRVRVYVFVCM